MNLQSLEEVRTRVQKGDPALAPAMEQLLGEAERALQAGPYTVVDKFGAKKGINPHDYVSLATYYWPNPSSPSGLPYVRRDGQENPELEDFDLPKMEAMIRDVATLTLAEYFTERADYAEHAVRLLRVWFVDKATRMNPHLKHGQFVPGHRRKGRNYGIIETRGFANELIPAIDLLSARQRLGKADRGALCSWFRAYLRWLRWSALGRKEGKQINNHGSCYFLQLAAFALFVGRIRLARRVLRDAGARLIGGQIAPDGSQPHELKRTVSMNYAGFNLSVLFDLADLAQRVGIDLWHYQTTDGRSLRRALDWLIPYWLGENPWEYEQIKPYPWTLSFHLARRSALAFQDVRYEQLIGRLPAPSAEERARDRITLLYPSPLDGLG